MPICSPRLTRLTSAAVAAACLLVATAPIEAQFNPKRKLILAAVCGGGAWGGFRLGDRLADMAIARRKLIGPQADKMRLSFRVGVAAAACGASAWLAGTVYDGLSKRDQQARKVEMETALADAEPGTRQYVLPDSRLAGRLETLPAEREDGRECRVQLDTLGNSNEPASTRWCRKNPQDHYEVDLGV
jgi:hypothetical protein